jgi:PIN domain nuclease of toxin-antitoxin system
VREIIKSPKNEIYVSAATGRETAIKATRGQLDAPANLEALIADEGFRELPVSFVDGGHTVLLPPIHRDPFDGVLIA